MFEVKTHVSLSLLTCFDSFDPSCVTSADLTRRPCVLTSSKVSEQPVPAPKLGPHGVQIVDTGPDHTFVLNEEALAELLLQDDIRDRAVVVLSVAGAFRKGKSFILNCFLRYMHHKYGPGGGGDWLGADDEPLEGFSWRGGSERDTTGILMWSEVFKTTLPTGEKVAVILLDTQGAFDSESTVRDCATVFALSTMLSSVQIYNLSQNIQEDDLQHLQYGPGGGGDWLGADDEPLEGFSWRGGSERDTTGILMWSEVFKTTLPTGEKVAVILLDTQGAFDSESTVRDCATVFALSTMLSSVQIYNLSQNIQEDDLQHLQLFTEYGRLALEDSGRTPFQRLQFLVRDWSFPYEAPYGAEGGQAILQRRLRVSDKQHPELQSLRKHITSCFSEIACFLMPHPGLKVATDPNFNGRLADIESEFKRALQQLVPMLLAPDNLVPKLINGQRVKAKDLPQYFRSYMNIYKGNELPEPKSMLVATAEANNLTAVAEAKEVYTTLMEEVCGGAKPYLQTQLLEAEHGRARDKALHAFHAKRKMGGDEFSHAYCEQLVQDLEEQFVQFRGHNESKNIFKAARTPSVFFAIAMFFYVLSGVFGLLGVYALANLCNLAMGVALLTLVMWAYISDAAMLSRVDKMAASVRDVLSRL
ncbi:Atlastin [Papilio xuthus]|uniref:Atlastin n=1 Tax=Papilio xuthus TaxID=66420 RepID=A0A194PFH4_PAPXU|nr:Atlastin [Papilio xuthus]